MARTYQIVSADGHIEVPPDGWLKHVPAEYRERAPRLVKLPAGGEAWVAEGVPMVHNGANLTAGGKVRQWGASYWNEDGTPAPGAGDGAQRLREQDQDGIDAEVLYPPIFISIMLGGINDREVYVSLIRAYNEFLAQDYCMVAPDRLLGLGVIPNTGIEDALAELRQCHELGLRGVSPTQFPNGGGYTKPEDDAFWQAALDLGVAIAPHTHIGVRYPPFMTASNPLAMSGGHPAAISLCTRPMGGISPMFTIGQLIVAVLFDRFPEPKIYFAETNASFLPGSLYTLDDNYAMNAHTFMGQHGIELEILPSEYVRKHCYFSIIRDPVALRMLDLLPAENLMWGSDFPHHVGSFPNARACIAEAFAEVPATVRRKILLENVAGFFGLPLERPITPTPA
jgi:predicted TIM-barrel fold metal-dependent hydrolase